MAQKDYVSRGRTSQKSSKKGPAKKPQARKQANSKADASAPATLPWVRLIIVVALLIGFVFFLWSIKDSAEQKVDAPVATQSVNNKDDLPELPEEEWEYIKSLPGYEVEVDVAEQEKSDKRYLMQCASFRTRAQAEEMKATIAFQGLESQIRPSSGANGEWFRVILGPFDSKRDAERAKHTLRKVNISTCQIWFWNL
ncbi:SPOR domain-containing protein [Alteromonas sp. ASW11-130]|uniref:SPOR domain-containing protein n=1 Tax=Alteromonas sp. ASW11-130 TaxID=3015775 RepID=UPI0022421F75|nr:SPOR domain-containing protein [Alteromonas sp. ASW11-130]MCW8091924.1 SPOR domain-containing protein [Alteromonas sp. ASW11-130]